MGVKYDDLIPVNSAPVNATAIGIYDTDGKKIGKINLNNSMGADRGVKLYSFGALSDIHLQYDTAQADFQRALKYLNETEDVAFTCITGDLTDNGSNNSLTTYKNYVENYSPDTPIYAVSGNHESYRGADLPDIIEQYTNYPLYYSFTYSNDVFIMLGVKSNSSGALFTTEELQWLYETLEENRNKRCLIFHHVRPQDGCGNAFGIYNYDIWGGTEATVFESLMHHYKNAHQFHGHSHLKFYLQYGSDIANIDHIFGGWSIHVPSLAVPRDGDVTGANSRVELYSDSEGYIVDMYENGIMLRGRDFIKEKFLPIATYWLDTPLQEIIEKSYIDNTGTIDTGDKPIEEDVIYINQIPVSTDVNGNIFNEIGWLENHRINSNGTETEFEGINTTGFIPFKDDDILRTNAGFISPTNTEAYCRIVYYDESKNYIGYASLTENQDANLTNMTISDDGSLYYNFHADWVNISDTVAYIRICSTGVNSNAILTINRNIDEIISSIDLDGALYNNGLGYKKDYRYKSSSGGDVPAEGIYTTGYIKVTAGDTIYFKNVGMNKNTTNANGCTTYFFSSLSGTAVGNHDAELLTTWNSAQWDENGNIVSCTMDSNTSYQYIRFNTEYLGPDSIITINQPTNQISLSRDTDGTIYNNGLGYKTGYRLNSSGTETAAEGLSVTGYIEVNAGDIIRFKNVAFVPNATSIGNYIAFYSETFEFKAACKSDTFSNYSYICSEVTTDAENGYITSFKLTNGINDYKYMRVSCIGLDENSIITINEEVELL